LHISSLTDRIKTAGVAVFPLAIFKAPDSCLKQGLADERSPAYVEYRQGRHSRDFSGEKVTEVGPGAAKLPGSLGNGQYT
jgi:hypothetical protein